MRGVGGGAALPLAIVTRAGNADRLACLTAAAEAEGLARGMTLSDARALCPGLVTRPADPLAEAAFLRGLARWATRFAPRVACDGTDGLVLDITGVAHLFGGEAALLADLAAGLARLGLSLRLGAAGTPGAAWALARFGALRVAAPGAEAAALAPLPPAALRLPEPTLAALDRLGLRRIADIAALPRAGLARRLGPEVLMRLDQATGTAPEAIAPTPEPPPLAVRLTLPEPIGLVADVMAGLARLLERLCTQLADAGLGARRLRLTLRRVDGGAAEVEIGLARPLRAPERIAAIFAHGVEAVEAGFGIDMLRLAVLVAEPLGAQQLRLAGKPGGEALADLLTRLGNRLGFEALWRLAPAASHIPEKSFLRLAAAFAEAAPGWPAAPGLTLADPNWADAGAAAAPNAPPRPAPAPTHIWAETPEGWSATGTEGSARQVGEAEVVAKPHRNVACHVAGLNAPQEAFAHAPSATPPHSLIRHEPGAWAAESTAQQDEAAQKDAARPQTGAKTAGTRAARNGATRAGKTALVAPLSSARPLLLFAPEPLSGTTSSSTPPRRFRWRRMELAATRAIGPERIAPEWWLDEPAWRSGLRDYWQVETADGRRLWLYHTPQNPGWFAQGEFA